MTLWNVTASPRVDAHPASRGSKSPRNTARTQHSAATVSAAKRVNPGTGSGTPAAVCSAVGT
eukprot:CAMPEP_0198680744 /NCGR_PEP_ID=MMETSP1468-20131203/5420_1 /TAXON_ID=1461545 /ORGANISM="Mantoniella sp, Strain CCMP1436" /LENGTH=61 /DNA_ID=CAMNT_0044421471 /DNA_START=509 /DNA_END=690 /DNA_ORIENTATION=-